MTRLSLPALSLGALLAVATPALATECIAPANPGGGWDFTCRQIGRILYEIGAVPSPVQVTNMAGAGGGVAYTAVVSDRSDDAMAGGGMRFQVVRNGGDGVTRRVVVPLGGDARVLL